MADIRAILKQQPRMYWLEKFSAHRIPAGPINSVADAAADDALQERGLFYVLADGERRIPQVGLGIHCDGSAAFAERPPPKLGGDTDHVLSELLGLTDAQIDDLCTAKAI